MRLILAMTAGVLAWAGVGGGLTNLVLAAPADEAEPLVQEGITFRTNFQDAKALERFQSAYRIAQTPRIEAQIGAAEQALGRWVDAEAHVAGALARASDPWIVKNRGTLEAALGAIRSHLGSLEILGEPEGAEILVDGRVAGRLPLDRPIRLPAGATTIEVRAIGHFAATRRLSIEAGKFTRETVVLESPTGSVNTGTSRQGANASVVEKKDPAAPSASPQSPSPSPSWRRPLAWSLAAAAAVGVGAGVAGLVIRNGKASDYNQLADSTGCAGADAGRCSELRSSGDHATVAAVVGFSAGGALAIISTLLFLAPTADAPAPVSALMRSCTSAWTYRGITCGLTF